MLSPIGRPWKLPLAQDLLYPHLTVTRLKSDKLLMFKEFSLGWLGVSQNRLHLYSSYGICFHLQVPVLTEGNVFSVEDSRSVEAKVRGLHLGDLVPKMGQLLSKLLGWQREPEEPVTRPDQVPSEGLPGCLQDGVDQSHASGAAHLGRPEPGNQNLELSTNDWVTAAKLSHNFQATVVLFRIFVMNNDG